MSYSLLDYKTYLHTYKSEHVAASLWSASLWLVQADIWPKSSSLGDRSIAT